MPKIKVAEVITRLDWGGSPDIVRIICTYLDLGLYELTLVIGLTKHPHAKSEEFLNNFRQKIKIVFIPELKREINPVSDLAAFLRLYFLFLRQRFDIVHTHTAKAGALGRAAAFLSGGAAIVHTLHGHNFYGYFNPFLSKVLVMIERFLACFTDRIIALTELEKNDLVRFKAAYSGKIRLIYQGLELEQYTPGDIDKTRVRGEFNIKPDERIIGMVGRLEPVKGPQYFVEAAQGVVRQFAQARFIVVGEGSLRKNLERQVEEAGLRDKFIFTGWRDDNYEIISILDILVLPSLNEAVGIVLLEAQSLGVPVVATKVGGVPEIVKDQETGILVPAGDSQSLEQAINTLLADEHKRKEMGERAAGWVKGKFKAQDMVDEISQLYQELSLIKK